jgi:hypothetical protein
MQAPTKISPDVAAAVVSAHEQEHIHNDRIDAETNGREVIAQYVRLMNGICGECGRVYVAGGEATTISASKSDNSPNPVELFNVGTPNDTAGGLLDLVA